MGYQVGILPVLLDWGLVVHEVPGWRTRGSSDFDPRGHVIHHDVVPDQSGDSDRIPGIIVAGRSDLPGPLANFWLERDGDVHLCAAGRANHAGEGGWNGLSGNSTVWGTEANNLGTPADPWPDEQLAAWYRLCAATCEFSGFAPAMVAAHREWAPGRKIDPHTLDMDAFRRSVAEQRKDPIIFQEDIQMLLQLKGKPALFVDGLPHLVPGSLVPAYLKGRETGLVELPKTPVGRGHYEKVAALVAANN
jgi:hypothetical protein